jgi:hypothetical protein
MYMTCSLVFRSWVYFACNTTASEEERVEQICIMIIVVNID